MAAARNLLSVNVDGEMEQVLNQINLRFDDLKEEMNRRFDEQDQRTDQRFDEQGRHLRELSLGLGRINDRLDGLNLILLRASLAGIFTLIAAVVGYLLTQV